MFERLPKLIKKKKNQENKITTSLSKVSQTPMHCQFRLVFALLFWPISKFLTLCLFSQLASIFPSTKLTSRQNRPIVIWYNMAKLKSVFVAQFKIIVPEYWNRLGVGWKLIFLTCCLQFSLEVGISLLFYLQNINLGLTQF